MKSILITWPILSQTWAKKCFYHIAETEMVTQQHYLYVLQFQTQKIENHYYSEKDIENERH